MLTKFMLNSLSGWVLLFAVLSVLDIYALKWCVRVGHMYQIPTLVRHISVKFSIQKLFVGFLTILAWF